MHARGQIIGAMTFGQHCLCPMRHIDREGGRILPGGLDLRWWMDEQHGFVIESVEAFATPVACKGMLGFWDVPPAVLEDLGQR